MSNKNKKLGLGIVAVAAAGAGLVYASMANSLKLPVGIENFEEIRKFGFL